MNQVYVNQVTPIETLLANYRQSKSIVSTHKLTFLGVGEADVYNISHAFEWHGEVIIAGRIEARNTEVSQIGFFKQVGALEYQLAYPTLPMMQDPCVEVIGGELIVGGTEIFAQNGHITHWHTSFFKGSSLNQLTKFLEAPYKMKDVRLIEQAGIHIFSRPQGGLAGPGKIGYTFAPDLASITTKQIEAAPLLWTQFGDKVWGGVNQVHRLKNGLLGIVGHIATMSAGDVRHYYGMVFAFDPKTRQATEVKIICERSDFQPGAYKRIDLIDVVFMGGLVRHPNQTATIYTGLSDAESHMAVIPDPFLEYERE